MVSQMSSPDGSLSQATVSFYAASTRMTTNEKVFLADLLFLLHIAFTRDVVAMKASLKTRLTSTVTWAISFVAFLAASWSNLLASYVL
jgi:hypothetical protein